MLHNQLYHLVLIVHILLLLLFASGHAHSQDWIYTVQPGDTIWDLSQQYLKNPNHWERIQALNKVVLPKRLPPGRRLRIPVKLLRMQHASARIVSQQGEVTIMTAKGKRKPLIDNLLLVSGDLVTTGADGRVTLRFSDASQVVVEANSQVVLAQLSEFKPLNIGDTQLELRNGELDVQVPRKKRSQGSRFRIRTRGASLAVRGTRYRARVPEAARTLSEVLEGRVSARGGRVTRVIPERFGTQIRAGRAPSKPRRLLAAPDVSGVPQVFDRLPIQFDMPAQRRAVGYRLQIGADDQFTRLAHDATFTSTRITGPKELADGSYTARIRSLDRLGLEGQNAVFHFELDAKPQPPVLMQPSAGSTVRATQPTFQWLKHDAAAAYRFQLARTADFTAPLVDLAEYDSVTLNIEQALAAGGYFWRVATVLGSGEVGPFSDPLPFTLRPAPGAPVLEPPALEQETLVFRWRAGVAGQSYQFQLARDYWFEDLVEDRVLAEPQIRLPRPEPGRYFMRIRTIDSDGYRGPFGARSEFSIYYEGWWQGLFIPAAFILLL